MITIICRKCETTYEIEGARGKHENELLIRYARCPTCSTPRDNRWLIKPTLPHIQGKCDVCHNPTRKIKYNLCEKHYVAKWKKEHNYNIEYMRDFRKGIRRRKPKLLQNNEVVQLS